MIKVYNKLVRDKIPEIIEESGAKCKVRVLTDSEYLEMIDKKLDEELKEYQKDKNLEELADMLEVIYAATLARGFTLEELEATRAMKKETRGGFEEKILLIETETK